MSFTYIQLFQILKAKLGAQEGKAIGFIHKSLS